VNSPALLVGLGGIFGALARHIVGARFEDDIHGTLTVNVLGSFLLGALLAAPVDGGLALVVGTGFCGAFTTFSSCAFETVRLFETGEHRRAAANATVNLVAALLAVAAGGLAAGALG
jgi:CrcB protein